MTIVEKTQLTLGFVPLTDSAPLVVAKTLGFFDQQGLSVTLQKQNSWATLRDKLHAGVLDAAQMLAPMPIASTLGLGCAPCPVVAPFILSLNGNAITISEQLHVEILETNQLTKLQLPLDAKRLRSVVNVRTAKGGPKLKFANVFPYSCHHYQLLDWLAQGGIKAKEIDILTVPPVNMVGFLESGEIDAFCVGGPWNAKAVRSEIGLTALTSYDVWAHKPEKVLGVTRKFVDQNPETVGALCKALKHACHWLENIPNRFEAAQLMTESAYLDAPLDVIAPSLIGSCLTHRSMPPRSVPFYNQFSHAKVDINQATVAHGEWLLEKMFLAGQIPDKAFAVSKLPDIFQV